MTELVGTSVGLGASEDVVVIGATVEDTLVVVAWMEALLQAWFMEAVAAGARESLGQLL